MPIECNIEVKSLNQDEFHQLDKSVMRHAFDIHNSLGRFCDEKIYQEELAIRCHLSGLESQREAVIRLIHGAFSKSYFVDMLFESAAIYELKASESIAPGHQNQLINYLLLTDTRHGKLLNFRSSSVQSRFVSTTMTRRDRMRYRLEATDWEVNDIAGENLRNCLVDLLDDWGICLDINAYREALLHFTSGPGVGLQPVPIMSRGSVIGSQKMCLLNPETAWYLSAVKSNMDSHEKHIRRLLGHTSLERLHWINLNQGNILLKTIKNDSVIK
jgi:GxxExxY protein